MAKEKLLQASPIDTKMLFYNTERDTSEASFNKSAILEALDFIGQDYLKSYVETNLGEYFYFEKFLSFADVVCKGKCRINIPDGKPTDKLTKKHKEIIKERVEANLLTYTKTSELLDIETMKRKSVCSTGQSCITVNNEFCDFINLPRRFPRVNKKYSLNEGVYKSYIVANTLDDFSKENTKKTFDSLGRTIPKNKRYKFDDCSETSDENGLINTNVTLLAQGIGDAKLDRVFQSVRNNAFVKDKIIVLIHKVEIDGVLNYKLFYMFYKNSIFYVINKLPSPSYVTRFYSDESVGNDEEPPRKGQAQWRDQLANISMVLNVESADSVICPFTNIEVNYLECGTLMRASHIKAYKLCKDETGKIINEVAFDLENGFLLCANADALFDKYLISVNPDTLQLEKSKKVSSELSSKIRLVPKIDEKYVSEKKKEYLREHYKIFTEKNI